MIELKIRHAEENLKSVIFFLLKRYDIDKEKIYTVITDNGTNMVKIVDLMSNKENMDKDNGNEIEANTVDFSN